MLMTLYTFQKQPPEVFCNVCSRTSNNMIKKLHESSIKVVLNDYSSDFNESLENNNDICNHRKNIQTLLIKVFKMKNELALKIMESMSSKRVNTYNLKNIQEFLTDRKRTI